MTGDCREVMATMGAESVDAVVTDPPYDLTGASRNGSPRKNDPAKPFGRHNLQPVGGFMGQRWDATGIAFDPATWEAVMRVMKPGAYLLAFGGTRTFHRMAVAIEDAGFEIKDCLSWLYGQGFPKHKSVLKPAWEPIILARKPAKRATELNIDACRIGDTGGHRFDGDAPPGRPGVALEGSADGSLNGCRSPAVEGLGRWPANVVLDEEAADAVDVLSGVRPAGNHPARRRGIGFTENGGHANGGTDGSRRPTDSGGASRFFYVAKASKAERDLGLAGMPVVETGAMMGNLVSGQRLAGDGTPIKTPTRANHHPTVKPLALMRWLVRLACPPGGTVLDPFLGSGTTLMACEIEGLHGIGIEQSEEYAAIARQRIAAAKPTTDPNRPRQLALT